MPVASEGDATPLTGQPSPSPTTVGGKESEEGGAQVDVTRPAVPTHHDSHPVDKQLLYAYYRNLKHKKHDQHSVFNSTVRFLLAVMIAVKMDGADINWGVVFWPVWIWLILRNCLALDYFTEGLDEGHDVDFKSLYAGTGSKSVSDMAKGWYSCEMVSNAALMICCQIVPCFMFIALALALNGAAPPATVSAALFPFWFALSICTLCCTCFTICGFCISPESMDSAVAEAQEKAVETGTRMAEDAAAQMTGEGDDGAGGIEEVMAQIDPANMSQEEVQALVKGDFAAAGVQLNPMQAVMAKTVVSSMLKEEGIDPSSITPEQLETLMGSNSA